MSLPTNFFIGRGGSWGYDFTTLRLVSYNQTSTFGNSASYLNYFSTNNTNNAATQLWMNDTRYFAFDNAFIWYVPEAGTYEFQVAGAMGGSTQETSSGNQDREGGDGAVVTARFDLQKKQAIRMIVGKNPPKVEAAYYVGNSGGGASAVMTHSPTVSSRVPLVVAGGGSGAAQSYYNGSRNSGKNAYNGTYSSTGQSNFDHVTVGSASYGGDSGNTTAGYVGFKDTSQSQQLEPGSGFYSGSQSNNGLQNNPVGNGTGGFGGGGSGGARKGGAGGGYTGGGSVSVGGGASDVGVGSGGSSYVNTSVFSGSAISASVSNYNGANNFSSAGQSGWIFVTKI